VRMCFCKKKFLYFYEYSMLCLFFVCVCMYICSFAVLKEQQKKNTKKGHIPTTEVHPCDVDSTVATTRLSAYVR
jgi:hypothetical protein